MERSIITALQFSFVWCTLYFGLCHFKPHRSNEWHCRTVTAIHACVVCLLCLWSAFIQGPWPFTEAGGPNTPLQNFTVMLCLGYFLFDLTWCLYFQTEGPAMLAHHIISVFGMTMSVLTGKYGTELIATIFGSEITNPLLQTRWFLRETGNYDTLLGEIVDHAFMFLFGFFRIGVGSYLLYTYFQQDTDLLGRFGALVIYGISCLFMCHIILYAIKKYNKKLNKSTKTSHNKSSETNGLPSNGNLKVPSSGDHLNGNLEGYLNGTLKNGCIRHDRINGDSQSHGDILQNNHLKQRVVKNNEVNEN